MWYKEENRMAKVRSHCTILQSLDLVVPRKYNITSSLSREVIKKAKKEIEQNPKMFGWQNLLMEVAEDKSIISLLPTCRIYVSLSHKIAHPSGKKYFSPWVYVD